MPVLVLMHNLKNQYFSYAAIWSDGQWGGYSPPPPPALAKLLRTQNKVAPDQKPGLYFTKVCYDYGEAQNS